VGGLIKQMFAEFFSYPVIIAQLLSIVPQEGMAVSGLEAINSVVW
jgi:hypothetical protein